MTTPDRALLSEDLMQIATDAINAFTAISAHPDPRIESRIQDVYTALQALAADMTWHSDYEQSQKQRVSL